MMKTSKPHFVIDTNIFVVAMPDNSKYNWVYQKLLMKEYVLCVSNEILTEYEEILSRFYGPRLAKDFMELLSVSTNVRNIIPYYHWDLISDDLDDNKFVDCAIAADADLIVTNDRHFNVLKTIDFPKLNIKNMKEFSDFMDMPAL